MQDFAYLREMNKVITHLKLIYQSGHQQLHHLRLILKIRDVICKGDCIMSITEKTGASIDIDQDGTVKVASVDGSSGREAVKELN